MTKIKVKLLRDFDVDYRKDLEHLEDVWELRPPDRYNRGVYNFVGTNMCQWYVQIDGRWYPDGEIFVVKPIKIQNKVN